MFPEFYSTILELILGGSLVEAEQEISVSYQQFSKDPLTKHNLSWLSLLDCRIQLQKNARLVLPVHHNENCDDVFFLSELCFVNGLVAFYSENFEKGIAEFKKAAELYRKANMKKKELLSEYNVYIGKATINFDWCGDEQIVFLNSLSTKAYLLSDHHLLSIIYRQRSIVYKELRKYQAAIEDSLKALELLLGTQNHSDAQGVYLNLCDVYLDLNEDKMAQLYFEKLVKPIDPRHTFSVAYIHARLNKLNEISVSNFSFVCPHYKKRAVLRNVSLNVEESLRELTHSERKLLVLLKESPRKKTELVKLIWPEKSTPKSLDNRLYQLIFRINKKSIYKIEKCLGLYRLASD